MHFVLYYKLIAATNYDEEIHYKEELILIRCFMLSLLLQKLPVFSPVYRKCPSLTTSRSAGLFDLQMGGAFFFWDTTSQYALKNKAGEKHCWL